MFTLHLSSGLTPLDSGWLSRIQWGEKHGIGNAAKLRPQIY